MKYNTTSTEEINEALNIVDTTLECMSEELKNHIVKMHIRGQIKSEMLKCSRNRDCTPNEMLGKVAERLQRPLSADGASAFRERLLKAGVDARSMRVVRGSFPVDTLGEIMEGMNQFPSKR